jgi:hypothetical protein
MRQPDCNLLEIIHRCLALVRFNEEIGLGGPDLDQLERDLLDAIAEFESAERTDTPPGLAHDQRAGSQITQVTSGLPVPTTLRLRPTGFDGERGYRSIASKIAF